jgi:hypothetical protein
MKAYLIDPYEHTITEVEYSGDYTDIYKLIDASCFDCVGFNKFKDTLYIDDEGLYKEHKEFFMIEGYPQPLVGKALVLGTNAHGNSIAPKISLTKLKSMVDFIPSIFITEVGPA